MATMAAFARACHHPEIQHSPSSLAEAEFDSEVLHLCGRERFGEGVGNHLVGRAVNKPDSSLLGDPA